MVDVVDDGNGRCVVAVAGEIDLANAERFESALQEALDSSSFVVVDLTRCSYIDSSGLNALVRVRRATDDDSRLVLVADLQTRRLLEIAGLDDAFMIYASRDEALSA